MDADFWRQKWRACELGWHRSSANPMLVKHVGALGLAPGARMFVPLCGKTLDIGWLLARGFRVAGAELVESAVEQLFDELGVASTIEQAGPLKRYRADGVDVFVGDLFDLTRETLGPVDAAYDRAALVAMPPEKRPAYAAHVTEITASAPQLLMTFDYDQSRVAGPPFSVPEAEVRELYASAYEVAPLDSAEVEGGLKGFSPVMESVWLLRHARA